MASSCPCAKPCEYCAEPTEPVTACLPCVPCVGTAIDCTGVLQVALRLVSTACTALLSVVATNPHLNAVQGPLTPATLQFSSCPTATAGVAVNGAVLQAWTDALTPGLLRLGSGQGEVADVVVANWGWPALGLTTCSDLTLRVTSPVLTAFQQLQMVVKGDATKNLTVGDVVVVRDITAGWGDVGVALLQAVNFVILE